MAQIAGRISSLAQQAQLLTQRATAAASAAAAAWFGAGNPLPPQAPEGVAGRQTDFPFAANTFYAPRGGEAVSFDQLRALADNCDIVRLLIETRKDQMERLAWNIRKKPGPDGKIAAGAEADPAIVAIETFLAKPDRVHPWNTWLRQLIEELLVTDAPTIYRHPTVGGGLYGLQLIDGATIFRVIDDYGRTPAPPLPAYQQILKGIPAVDYTADELLYRPRNVRVHKLYGFSPVEQIVMTINIAIRRAVFQMNYFTEGNIPEALIGTPENWTPKQIAEFQSWFDSVLAGNLAARRKGIFVPGAIAKGMVFTKDPELKGVVDEWLARIACFCFSMPATPFITQVNRATSENAHDAALEEGLWPLQLWVKQLIDEILAVDFKRSDLEFVWKDDREADPQVVAEIAEKYVRNAIKTINEQRGELGLDPVPGGDKPLLLTATGFVALDPADRQKEADDAAARAAAVAQPQQDDGDGTPPGKGGKPPKDGQDGEVGKSAGAPFAKASPRRLATPQRRDEAIASATARLEKWFARFLKAQAGELSFQLASLLTAKAVRKADGGSADDDDSDAIAWYLRTSTGADADALEGAALDALVDELLDALTYEGWAVIADEAGAVEAVLNAVFETGVLDSLEMVAAATGGSTSAVSAETVAHFGVSTDQVNALSVGFARARSAEMVGMKRLADGSLVANPKAQYVITDATRDMMRGTILEAIEEGASVDELAEKLVESYAFSATRARMIARTEIIRANNEGNIAGYRASGVVTHKEWLTGAGCCDLCEGNAEEGAIPLEQAFQSGDLAPPGHPNCRCSVAPAVVDESDV
jgi:hypothetical protein